MACALVVTSCGDARKAAPAKGAAPAGAGPATEVPVRLAANKMGSPAARMLALVPEGTFGVIYIPRIKKLGEGLERIVAATTPPRSGRGKTFSLDLLARQMGLDLYDFDLTRPAGIALSRPANPKMPPGVTAIIPVRDEKDVAAKLKAMNPKSTVTAADGFVVLVEKGPYKAGGVSEAMDAPLPEGDLVLRLDVASLWETYGGQATSAVTRELEELGTDAPAAAVKPAFDAVKSVVEAATLCDVVLRIDGTNLQADAALHFPGGATVPVFELFSKADLSALARAIPSEGMMSVAMALDPKALWSSVEPLASASLETAPEPARKVFQKAFDSVGSALALLGGGMVMTGGLRDGRVELCGVVETADPAAYVAAMVGMTAELPTDGSPVTARPLEERMVAGTKVTTLRVEFDTDKMAGMGGRAGSAKSREAMATLFGNEPLTYNFVELEKKVVLVMGSDEVLERTVNACKAGKSAPMTSLAMALAAAGPDTVGYFSMDLGALIREVTGMAARVTGNRSMRKAGTLAESMPITFILNAGSGQIRCRASVDIGKMAKLYMGMMPK